MPARLNKSCLNMVETQVKSLTTIKKVVEDFGGTCKIDWATETVNIDVPPGKEFGCAIVIERALKKAEYSNLYKIDDDADVFVGKLD